MSNVVSISSELVSHSTVSHYFATLGTLPELDPVEDSTPVVEDTKWVFLPVHQYFASPVAPARVVEDVVIAKTGRACSQPLGRVDSVFSDFGGAS
ncbi:MAG: hypothetical protein AAF658_21755 [Myxococcota bacterium]